MLTLLRRRLRHSPSVSSTSALTPTATFATLPRLLLLPSGATSRRQSWAASLRSATSAAAARSASRPARPHGESRGAEALSTGLKRASYSITAYELVLRALGSLESIKISTGFDRNPSLLNAFAQHGATLTDLEIVSGQAEALSTSTAAALLRNLPELRRLAIVNMELVEPGDEDEQADDNGDEEAFSRALASHNHLETLRTFMCDVFNDHFANTTTYQAPLRHVFLNDTPDPTAAGLSPFLTSIATNVESLGFGPMPPVFDVYEDSPELTKLTIKKPAADASMGLTLDVLRSFFDDYSRLTSLHVGYATNGCRPRIVSTSSSSLRSAPSSSTSRAPLATELCCGVPSLVR